MDITKILELHKKWLADELGGKRADLRGAYLQDANLQGAYLQDANLQGANLQRADLRGANLQGADLRRAYLRGAYLQRADLRGADLQRAYLQGANLQGAYLQGADLQDADLRCANLRGANLQGAYLQGADLQRAYFDSTTSYVNLQCPEDGPFTAYKKAGNHVVKLWIPSNAKRSSATGRKCRCDKAQVLEILNLDRSSAGIKQIVSDYDKNFVYVVGQTVKVDNFEVDRWIECTAGIHFFITFDEAAKY